MRNHAAQLAIIKQLSRQESCSSAGNCQADERTLITQLSSNLIRKFTLVVVYKENKKEAVGREVN